MGVIVSCNSKDILDIKNVTFESLYDAMLSVIEGEGIVLSNSLNALFEKLYVGAYGVGCDIANYISKKDDFMQFAYIVKRGIEEDGKEYPFRQDVLDHLWNFHAELLKYGEKLS